jgi:DNA primase
VERGVVGPQTFTLRTIAKRVAEVGELWAEMLAEGQSLRHAIESLDHQAGAAS